MIPKTLTQWRWNKVQHTKASVLIFLDLVNYHIVGSTYYSEGIYDGLTLTTLQGSSMFFTVHIDGIPGQFIL